MLTLYLACLVVGGALLALSVLGGGDADVDVDVDGVTEGDVTDAGGEAEKDRKDWLPYVLTLLWCWPPAGGPISF